MRKIGKGDINSLIRNVILHILGILVFAAYLLSYPASVLFPSSRILSYYGQLSLSSLSNCLIVHQLGNVASPTSILDQISSHI